MSKYASNNETRRKTKNSNSNLNISDSNDFWNDCQAEEYIKIDKTFIYQFNKSQPNCL